MELDISQSTLNVEVEIVEETPLAVDLTVPQGADGLVFQNDKPTLAIFALNDGSSPVLTDAAISVSIIRGINNDTANWTITATPTGCAGTLVDHTTYYTYTVSGMTSDTATVAFSAARSGFATLSSVSTLTKIKQPNIVSSIEAGTATATPADTDVLPGVKADHSLLKYTWANLKAAILTAIGKVNAAVGFTLAGGTTPKTLTVSADADTANVPTANEKTRLSDIQAATGATTALKLANLASPATNAQQGVAELATSAEIITGTDEARVPSVHELRDAADLAGFWLAKRTKMPDVPNPQYAVSTWVNTDGFEVSGAAVSTPAGKLIITPNAGVTGAWARISASLLGKDFRAKTVVIGLSRAVSSTALFRIRLYNITTTTLSEVYVSPIGTSKRYFSFLTQADTTHILFYPDNTAGNDAVTIDMLWIGDPDPTTKQFYAVGSLSEEAARIADQLGDTAGVGVAASGAFTGNVSFPIQAGDTFAYGGKTYTFIPNAETPDTEGEIKLGTTNGGTLSNLANGIVGDSGTKGTTHFCAANLLGAASYPGSGQILTLTAKSSGITGNQITLSALAAAVSGGRITLSGSTLSGGIDDVGKKIITQVQNRIAASGTRPAAAMISDTVTDVGYENTVDVASGGTYTLPAGGTWRWCVYGYGATVSSAKRGSSAGGTTLTVAGANATLWVRKVA